MTQVMIKFAPNHVMTAVHFKDGAQELVRTALKERTYTNSDWFEVAGTGLAAADEVFDLTNNPGRQEECLEVYGRGRSLSVGDIVVVGEEKFLCMSVGWEKL